MEESKLLALHKELKSHGPAGGRGGLGVGKERKRAVAEDTTLPKNALYSRFVRAGTWNPDDDMIGADFIGKRQKFDDDDEVEKEGRSNDKRKSKGEDDVLATITLRAGGGVELALEPPKKSKNDKKEKREKKEKASRASASGDDDEASAKAPLSGKKRKRPSEDEDDERDAGATMNAADMQIVLQAAIVSALEHLLSKSDGKGPYVKRSKVERQALVEALEKRGKELKKAGYDQADRLEGLINRAFAGLILSGAIEVDEDGERVKIADADETRGKEGGEKKEKKDKKGKKTK